MTDEALAVALTLPLREFLVAILDDAPHTPAKDLQAAAQAAGKPCSKGEAKRVRDAWAAGPGGGAQPGPDEVTGAPPTIDQVRARLREAVLAGDSQAVTRWARSLAILEGLAPPPAADPGAFRWDLLSEAERACLLTLCAKAGGEPLDADGLWFVALLARVPGRPEARHPAHLPLPEVTRPVTLTV